VVKQERLGLDGKVEDGREAAVEVKDVEDRRRQDERARPVDALGPGPLSVAVEEQHDDRAEEVGRTKHLDEVREEPRLAVGRHVLRHADEDLEDVERFGPQPRPVDVLLLEVGNHHREDAGDRLLDDLEGKGVVALRGVGADRDKDRKRVLEDDERREPGKLRDEQERLLEGLGVLGVGEDLHDDRDVDGLGVDRCLVKLGRDRA
jgi:hypothetical protein